MAKYFDAKTTKNPLEYKIGEEIEFVISAYEDDKELSRDLYIERHGDDGKEEVIYGRCEEGKPFIYKDKIDNPGFIILDVSVCENKKKGEEIDTYPCGAGANIYDIPYYGNIPNDYDEYWQGIKNNVIKNGYEVINDGPIPGYQVREGFVLKDLKLKTYKGDNARACLTYPKKEGKYPIEVVFYGYGSGGADPVFKEDTIVIRVCAHDFDSLTKADDNIAKDPYFALYGFDEKNNSRDDCYWNGMIVRDLTALLYVKENTPWNKKDLLINGSSQGGFQSALVASLEEDATFVQIDFPWFSNLHAEEHNYFKGWRPEPAQGLEYYDTALSASRLSCPVNMIVGLGDHTCPPHSIMAVYNSIKKDVKLTFTQGCGHGNYQKIGDKFTISK